MFRIAVKGLINLSNTTSFTRTAECNATTSQDKESTVPLPPVTAAHVNEHHHDTPLNGRPLNVTQCSAAIFLIDICNFPART